MSDAATQEKTTTLDLDKLADTLRGRVDLFGKALAAIATLGTGAVGLAKVADLSPWEDGEGRWVVVVVGCLVAAAVAGIYVSVRLMGVSTPVVLEPSVDTSTLDTSKLGSPGPTSPRSSRRPRNATVSRPSWPSRSMRRACAAPPPGRPDGPTGSARRTRDRGRDRDRARACSRAPCRRTPQRDRGGDRARRLDELPGGDRGADGLRAGGRFRDQ